MKNNRAGFSLAEAIVAIILIVIAAIVALSYMVYCSRLAIQADSRIMAANFARETMENLYKRDYSDTLFDLPTGDPVTKTDPLPTTGFGSGFKSRYPAATRTYTIANSTDETYKIITVKVTWN